MSRPVRDLFLTMLVTVSFACLTDSVSAAGRPLFVNEIMASNSSAARDPQGEYDDWIELYNASGAPADFGGLYLTDDPGVPTKWQIPTGNRNVTTIPAKGFLLVWADEDTKDAGLHASFKLDADGDAVYLFDSDGSTLIDGIEFDKQASNVSYGRCPHGTGERGFL